MNIPQLQNAIPIGNIVYLKTDVEQHPCIVIGYSVFRDSFTYRLGRGPCEYFADAIEVTDKRDEAMMLGIDKRTMEN